MSFGKEAVSFSFGLDAKSVRLELAETLLSLLRQVPH